MEGLLQYIWQHKLWLSEDMVTNDGRKVRVIDPGLLNTDSGPDFFNAKVEIDGHLWVGNVEIHVRASDWKRHHHDEDPAYDNVILHVVEKDDAPVSRINGEVIPQVVLQVSPRFNECYDRLVNAQVELPCAARLGEVPALTVTEWIEALAFERLHGKVDRVRELYDRYNGSWEDICYVLLARTLGFGINNDAFERLARVTPLRLLHKHRDSILQVEALLFGQAGLLGGAHSDDTYYQQLMREYAFLANKFSLRPIEGTAWRLFRSRQHYRYLFAVIDKDGSGRGVRAQNTCIHLGVVIAPGPAVIHRVVFKSGLFKAFFNHAYRIGIIDAPDIRHYILRRFLFLNLRRCLVLHRFLRLLFLFLRRRLVLLLKDSGYEHRPCNQCYPEYCADQDNQTFFTEFHLSPLSCNIFRKMSSQFQKSSYLSSPSGSGVGSASLRAFSKRLMPCRTSAMVIRKPSIAHAL